MSKELSIFKRFFCVLALCLILTSCGVSKSKHDVPDVSIFDATISKRIMLNDTTFTSGANSLYKNK